MRDRRHLFCGPSKEAADFRKDIANDLFNSTEAAGRPCLEPHKPGGQVPPVYFENPALSHWVYTLHFGGNKLTEPPILGKLFQRIALPVWGSEFHGGPLRFDAYQPLRTGILQPATLCVADDEYFLLSLDLKNKPLFLNVDVARRFAD
jgi:hypothetical protein